MGNPNSFPQHPQHNSSTIKSYNPAKHMANHRITSARFVRYKAFNNFSLSLQDFNVLVGPNNAGKSTILSAFRILWEGIRRAKSRRAEPINVNGLNAWGHRIDIADLPVSTDNIFFEYDDNQAAEVRFRVSNGNHLRVVFPDQDHCYLISETTNGRVVQTPSQFSSQFDIDISFVPILGPVEINEQLFQKEAARRALLNSTASRNFRNIWYHYPEEFELFKEAIQTTWPGMDINRPEISADHRHLIMFCPEDRRPRELAWAGYGFQVWCQMLTHIVKSVNASLLIIDEPDIYLHPDLQRQLVSILRELGPDILLATHSTELITECEPTSLLSISKNRTSAVRIRDVSQLKGIFSSLGSTLNPTLSQLAKTRRVVFVEGLDFPLLAIFARTLGHQEVATRVNFAVMRTEGFNPRRAIDLANGIEEAVGSAVCRAVVLDRDYRSADEISEITTALTAANFSVFIHECKEIENYLLNPTVVRRATSARVVERARRTGENPADIPNIAEILDRVANDFRLTTFSQIQARNLDYARRNNRHLDPAPIMAAVSEELERQWQTNEGRNRLLPGKECLARLNTEIQNATGASVSSGQIATNFQVAEIPEGMKSLIEMLLQFGRQNPDA